MRKACLIVMSLLLPLLIWTGWIGESSAAAVKGKIVLDNQELTLPSGAAPENVNGSVMIPIRVVSESLGYQVKWDQKVHKVTISQDFKTIQLTVGSKLADADGVTLNLNAAPKQTGGTVLVPIRFVSEQFGLSVGWDNREKTVYLSANPISMPSAAPASQAPQPSASQAASATPSPSATPSTSATPASSSSQASPTPTPSAGIPGTAAVQVKGAAFEANQLMIAVSGSVQPAVTSLDNPNRIVVELPSSMIAPDLGGGLASGILNTTGYPLISGISYSTAPGNPTTVRFEISTTERLAYQLSVDAGTGLITVSLGTGTSGGSTGNGRPVVVLDAGHGGTQPGATSAAGRKEKDFNLVVIQKVGALLQNDGRVDVVYTRTQDVTLSLEGRVSIAEAAGADVFVSVHANAMPTSAKNWTQVNGSETYYSRSESLPLARVMHKHLVAGTGLKDNGIRAKSLHVTRETSMPAVLLEAGYLTNVSEAAKLYSTDFQDSLAREIAAGILEYLGL